jgi:hypothetical protein
VIASEASHVTSLGRVRYARASDIGVWLQAPDTGFVAGITSAMADRSDRVVLGWPSRPDNGFVTAAIALREARTASDHGTVGLWPWRSAATHAARSIFVHPEDISRSASRRASSAIEHPGRRTAARVQLAYESLCLVELRLNDLVRFSARRTESSGITSVTEGDGSVARLPTLLETTSVFPPNESTAASAYRADPDQVLKRVRRYTTLETIPDHVGRIGDPLLAPFALMGLSSARRDLERCLAHDRLNRHGLDVVVIDLTRMARMTLSADWRRDFQTLLEAIDLAALPRRPAVVVLCEDGFVMQGAAAGLRRHAGATPKGRQPAFRCGAIVLRNGVLEKPGAATVAELSPLRCDADVKDASLRPVRDRIISLARRLREVGHARPAIAVGSTLRVLSSFASLPLGVSEAKSTAQVLFNGDGHDDVKARSHFFPSWRLQRLAEVEAAAPEFASDVRSVLDDVSQRITQWDGATPVSLKLRGLLADSDWNARDVLLILPDARTRDVFMVSDSAMDCFCTVIDASAFAQQADAEWRRILIVRPEPRTVRALLTMRTAPGSVLLLGDCAGVTPVAIELSQLASLREFAPFAARAKALTEALTRGGADATLDAVEAEFHYRFPATEEDFIDLAQASDDYTGPTVRLRFEGGARAAYRPGGDILLFTPDAIRPFTRIAAQDVMIGASILVLRKDIRDRLSDALSRSRKTAAQLKVYHERIAQYRRRLSGTSMRAKAREALAAMRLIDASIGEHEIPNLIRWLSVEPSDTPRPPHAARDRRRFRVFVQAAGLDAQTADAFWDLAILPVRAYSTVEGHAFNRRIVQFVVDPEGVAAGTGWYGYRDLWQAVVDSVECVTEKEVTHG